MEPIDFIYDKPIRSHFSIDKEVLICLFPFYHKVFADHYNWQENVKKAFPLLETLRWSSVSKGIGFNSLDRLALGILELHEPFKTELKEYCECNKFDVPDYEADRIPEVLLIPMIRYFQKIGLKTLELKSIDRFPSSKYKMVPLKEKSEFDIYNGIKDAKCIATTHGLEILLPDYDCPYALISGDKKKCFDIVTHCNLECIEVTQKTVFDWWNQGYLKIL